MEVAPSKKLAWVPVSVAEAIAITAAFSSVISIARTLGFFLSFDSNYIGSVSPQDIIVQSFYAVPIALLPALIGGSPMLARIGMRRTRNDLIIIPDKIRKTSKSTRAFSKITFAFILISSLSVLILGIMSFINGGKAAFLIINTTFFLVCFPILFSYFRKFGVEAYFVSTCIIFTISGSFALGVAEGQRDQSEYMPTHLLYLEEGDEAVYISRVFSNAIMYRKLDGTPAAIRTDEVKRIEQIRVSGITVGQLRDWLSGLIN